VASGLVVHEPVIRGRLDRYLPFLVTEKVLIAGVRAGGDRQDLHERIRRHAMEARRRMDEGASDNDFLDRVAGDPEIPLERDRLEELVVPAELVGRAPEQVDRFLQDRVAPRLEEADDVPEEAELRV